MTPLQTDRQTDTAVADMPGSPALPRRNGELVFHDDWERRVFAMAVALCEQGHFEWNEFREHLIAAIDETGESPEHPNPQAPGYYEHWLASFETLLSAKGIAAAGDVPNPTSGDQPR